MRTSPAPILLAALLAGCSSQSPTDAGRPSVEAAVAPDRWPAAEAPRPEDAARPDLGRVAACAKLVGQYRELLAQAKTCTLQAGASQCQKLVDDFLGCGCLTSVEAGNAKPLAEMSQLVTPWLALGCQQLCPKPPCRIQPRGACVTSSEGPRCEDQSR